MRWLILVLLLAGCQKPDNYEELPETKYPEVPVYRSWEESSS
jgi:hypothetical protein